MKDRLKAARDAAAELAEKAQRLLPGGSSDNDTTVEGVDNLAVEDDEDDEELPSLEVSDADHEDLDHLDDEDVAEPIRLKDDLSIFELLHKIDPTPAVPLTEKHEVGLVALLDRFSELTENTLADDPRGRRVLDLVGDRLSIAVGPDGITVRGLLLRKHTPWKRVQGVSIQGRYDLIRSDGIAKLLEGIQAPLPVPGLRWLLRRVTRGIAMWLEKHLMTVEKIGGARETAGNVLIGIKRWGRDIEFTGVLLQMAFMAPGLAEAVEQEARLRGVPVEVIETGN